MLISCGFIILGFGLLILGGDLLLRGAVSLAKIMDISPAIIGLTVVAAGTSVPELAISVLSAYQGKTDLSVANVVGSNIFNLTIIPGLCSLFSPLLISQQAIRRDYSAMLSLTVIAMLFALGGLISRVEGLLLFLLYLGFTIRLIAKFRDQGGEQQLEREVRNDWVSTVLSAQWNILLVIIGSLVLAGGAEATVHGASDLARRLGLSDRIIGLTIVSAGTGLPEVVASLLSLYRGRADVALSNVFGSNLFNISVILGLSALISPLSVRGALLSYDFPWMLALTVILLPMLLTGKRISRGEGALLLGSYGVYVAFLFLSF